MAVIIKVLNPERRGVSNTIALTQVEVSISTCLNHKRKAHSPISALGVERFIVNIVARPFRHPDEFGKKPIGVRAI